MLRESRVTVRRLADMAAHRLLYTLLLAFVTLGVVVLVIPVIRQYSGTHEQIIGMSLVVVLLVETAGSRLRRLVDWLLYGQRGDVAKVSSRLAVELESGHDDQAVAAMVSALAGSLRLSYAAAAIDHHGVLHVVASTGPEPRSLSRFPVRHSGRLLGELRAARRGVPLDARDDRMLAAAAAQLGVLLHAAGLAADLQQARERLVTSREDERRRLRRELHDGVGPTLAGIALGIESARGAIGTDQERAGALLAEIRSDVSALVEDVRQVVDGLRPPMIDEVGLIPSLRQLGSAFAARSSCSVEVRGEALPELSAAVEVAAYRIGAEAMTNVVRHAQARTCALSLSMADGHLVVEVVDDGIGGASPRDGGTGLRSVAERAQELGGTLTVQSTQHGTRVVARIPVSRDHDRG